MTLNYRSVYVATQGVLTKRERERKKGRKKETNKQTEILLEETNIMKVTMTVTSHSVFISVFTTLPHKTKMSVHDLS